MDYCALEYINTTLKMKILTIPQRTKTVKGPRKVKERRKKQKSVALHKKQQQTFLKKKRYDLSSDDDDD